MVSINDFKNLFVDSDYTGREIFLKIVYSDLPASVLGQIYKALAPFYSELDQKQRMMVEAIGWKAQRGISTPVGKFKWGIKDTKSVVDTAISTYSKIKKQQDEFKLKMECLKPEHQNSPVCLALNGGSKGKATPPPSTTSSSSKTTFVPRRAEESPKKDMNWVPVALIAGFFLLTMSQNSNQRIG